MRKKLKNITSLSNKEKTEGGIVGMLRKVTIISKDYMHYFLERDLYYLPTLCMSMANSSLYFSVSQHFFQNFLAARA